MIAWPVGYQPETELLSVVPVGVGVCLHEPPRTAGRAHMAADKSKCFKMNTVGGGGGFKLFKFMSSPVNDRKS